MADEKRCTQSIEHSPHKWHESNTGGLWGAIDAEHWCPGNVLVTDSTRDERAV